VVVGAVNIVTEEGGGPYRDTSDEISNVGVRHVVRGTTSDWFAMSLHFYPTSATS
jgi:hypothetical protein